MYWCPFKKEMIYWIIKLIKKSIQPWNFWKPKATVGLLINNLKKKNKKKMNSSLTILEPTMSCKTSLHWGIYLSVLFMLSLTINSGVLAIVFINKELRSTTNKFLIAMMLVCLIGTVTDLPLLIIKNFSCG